MVTMHKNAGRYMEYDNGPGCGGRSIGKEECALAARLLGYRKAVQEVSVDHAPYGCFVGHPTDSWKYTYFNNRNGLTGREKYKSICLEGTYFCLIVV